jgi:hypothetical protein
MATENVTFIAAGTAEWSAPARESATQSQVLYHGRFMGRMIRADGTEHFLRMNVLGMDVITDEGEVPTGYGSVEADDNEGDMLVGKVVWSDKGQDIWGGDFTFVHGTGKFAGASAQIEVKLQAEFEGNIPLPPTAESRVFGFMDGGGTLTLP